MAGKKSKKNKKNKKNNKEFTVWVKCMEIPNESSFARYGDEDRRRRLDVIQNMMDYLGEVYGDPERQKQALGDCAATIEAYAEYAEAITGEQYIFNLQSKYSSDDIVAVDTFVDESMSLLIN
ncbi:PREDICTED: uncharacterized protein LOC109173365 [Ipomoea nil]|uniref:uncharacterized protein LOC109173365 n=1 Tax=Ipomoea nil TaxID=35883 RepID=UPI000901B709|nr:PREDICTED: uncharacterized protein LOC109173365 [Ipomoea nil]